MVKCKIKIDEDQEEPVMNDQKRIVKAVDALEPELKELTLNFLLSMMQS